MNVKRILTPLLIILLLFSIVVMGAPTYVNLGPTSEITGDVGIPDGSGYYINDILFSTTGLIDISTLAKTDGGIIVGDGTNFILETGVTARASLGLTIGSDVQAYDAGLLSIAGLTYSADSFVKATATDTYALRTASEVKTDLSLNNVENLKVKLDATQAPTVNNDVDEGYAVGSRWCDVTNDKEYVCLDNTDGAAVWTETTQSGGGGAFTDLTDTPANYTGSSLKHVRVNVGETALEFVTLGGGGDMLKATYDTDEDGDVDVAAGGTEKSSWTLYAIPYLSGTTAFGEIPIGTAEYALTVNAGANGYDWTLFLEDLIDDTTPEYGGAMDHNNERDIEVKTVEFNGLYDNGNSGAAPTINWQNGNYQKIAVSENTLFTFSNAFIGTITLQITYSGAYTAGFNVGYTILEEGGIEVSFTETLNAVDILKVMYLGTANNYVVGLMADVKD